MVLLTLTGRNKDGIEFHLKFPASKELDRSSLKSCADDTRVDNLIKKAVTTSNFRKHHIKYPKSYIDPEAMHRILLEHSCPLAQGPVICAIDGVDKDYKGEKVMSTNTMFQHQESQKCVEWIPIEKNEGNLKYEVKEFNPEQFQIQGAASNRDMSIVYTCQFGRCRINCSCSICMDKSVNCRLKCKMEICSDCAVNAQTMK